MTETKPRVLASMPEYTLILAVTQVEEMMNEMRQKLQRLGWNNTLLLKDVSEAAAICMSKQLENPMSECFVHAVHSMLRGAFCARLSWRHSDDCKQGIQWMSNGRFVTVNSGETYHMTIEDKLASDWEAVG